MPFPTIQVTQGTGTTINTLPPAGQNSAAESLPVVLASDQTLPLPSGAATSALQTTGNNALAVIAGAITGGVLAVSTSALPLPSGAATAALQVTGNNALTTLAGIVTGGVAAVSVATLPLPSGAATSALQTTGNSYLSTLAGVVSGGAAAISAASLPLPAGAATSANQATMITAINQLHTDLIAPLPSGTNLIGAVNLDIAGAAVSQTNPAYTSPSTAQGSTTAGQYGNLTLAAVTTAAPSYTTAQSSPLSLTVAGALRGDMSSYAGTALTGTVTAYGTAPSGNVFGVNAAITQGTLTTVSTVTSLSQIAGSVPQMNIANGSTNKEVGVSVATAISQTDVSAGAFAGAGRVNGTIIASAAGSGAWVSAEINVSTLTLGTATAVFAILQESRGGSNFSDIWTSDPITTTSTVSMPALPVGGRRRWSFFSCGGTSTTVTATITALELPPMAAPLVRQARDFYAATNPLASMFNSTALTASNFVLSTLNSATTPLYVEGTKLVTAFMILAGSPTVTTQPVVTMQGSMDGTNWFTISGSTMTAAGNGMYAASVANTAFKWVRLAVTTAAAYSAGSYTISNIGVNAVN